MTREIEFSIPFDDDGFFRRACPNCEREFKRFGGIETPETESEVVELADVDGGYFCPYCGCQDDPSAYFTEAQLEQARSIAAAKVMDPLVEGVRSNLADMGFGSDYKKTNRVEPMTEPNDMKRINFRCHPKLPVKVLEGWNGQACCTVCGSRDSASAS